MAPKIGHFVLHSNFQPEVTAGEYELVTSHTGTPFTADTVATNIYVKSPRFSMPTDQILSTFPPANAEGFFGDRLPQIVLKRRTLPWERNPAGVPQPSATPWLALVVVAEGEGELSSPTPVADCVGSDVTLLDPDDTDVDEGVYLAVTETVVDKIFPTEEDLPLLTHVREVDVTDTELADGDDDGWLAVVLANRLPVHDEVADKPVRYLACLVNVEGQLESLPEPSDPLPHFGFELAQDWTVLAASTDDPDVWVTSGGTKLEAAEAILLDPSAEGGPDAPAAPASDATPAATEPAPAALAPEFSNIAAAGPAGGAQLDGSAAYAKAKSTDNWSTLGSAAAVTSRIAAAAKDPDAAYKVRNTMRSGFNFPISKYAAERVLRFPVLAHWSFTAVAGDTFETIMQNLDVGLMGTVVEPVPEDPPRPEPPEVVASGHLSMGHRTRRGDAVRAWYRGPLVPHPTERTTLGEDRLAHASDQLRLVVPDGREDLSYASAFEIGRLLALSQLSVVSALLRFRRDQFGAARLREQLSDKVPLDLDGALDDFRVDLGHLVSTRFVGQVAADPGTFAGPRRPIADPGRPIEELSGLSPAKLDAVIAGGFGFDLDRLEKQAEMIGMAAALAETQVPVAEVDGSLDANLGLLRHSLFREVVRLADIAVPPGGLEGAPDADDALDELETRLGRLAPPTGEDDD